MKRLSFVVLCLLVLCTSLEAQILRDTAAVRLLYKEVDCINDFQFSQANEIYHKLKLTYPEHPVTYIIRGLMTYWENYPLTANSPMRKSFENDMRHAMDLCDKKAHPNDPGEYLLCTLGARGLLLLFYADNDLNMDVISLASGTYSYLRKSFDYTDEYDDFYFFTGLYNYYREAYPDAHPVYKPLARLFPKGDLNKGLKELDIASKKAMVLKGESYSFLNLIYINYENNYGKATSYARALHQLYPGNIQYTADYVKNLLLVKQYDEAESVLNEYQSKSTNGFGLAQLEIYKAIIYEKKYHNLAQADSLYKDGINDIAPYGAVGNEVTSFAYFGLSRISDVNDGSDSKHYKKLYRKQALELSSYKKINFDE
jgi:hypothetical protein